MAYQRAKSRQPVEKIVSVRRPDVIRCEKCGEDYSVTYKCCPFCDERPGRGGNYIQGKQAANPLQLAGLAASAALIVAAMFIVLTKVSPMFTQGSHVVSGGVTSVGNTQSVTDDQTGDGTASSTVEAVTLSCAELTLDPDDPYQLFAAVSPSDVEEPVVWSSSDTMIAMVDEDGFVTNVNTGTSQADVTITATCGGITAQCVVTCPAGSTYKHETSATGSAVTVSGRQEGVVTNAGSDGLNIRSGPGSSYERVASAQNGATVTILEDTGTGWYKINYSGSKTGYVSSDYVVLK
jgi:hypothetical protein